MQSHIRINGFTLVETIVALIVLAVGMLGVARMFAGSIHLSGRARLLTDVGMSAQAVAETIRSTCKPASGDSSTASLELQWTGQIGAVQTIQVVVRSRSADSRRADTVTAYGICSP